MSENDNMTDNEQVPLPPEQQTMGGNYTITTEVINSLIQSVQHKRDEKDVTGFPLFDPDHSRIDARKWCEDVDLRTNRDNLENYDIIPRVQTALKGRAKLWYEKAGYQHYDWLEIIDRIKSGDNDTCSQYVVKSGLLYKKLGALTKIYVPQSFRKFHDDNCHIGWEKTKQKMQENFWMPSMTRNVRKFVESCIICLIAKRPSGKQQCELQTIDKIPLPFHTIHVDYMGPIDGKNKDDHRYVFILIDAFTKFVVLFPCKSLKTTETVQLFQNYIALFGVPARVISDRGTNFTSEEFKKLCVSLGIDHHLIAPGSSRANGQVERYVDSLANLLRTNLDNGLEWTNYVSRVQLALNTTFNKTTGFSPLKLLTGVSGRTPESSSLLAKLQLEPQYEDVEALRRLADERTKDNAARMKTRFDKTKSKPSRLMIGQKVLYHSSQIRKTKLQPYFIGPYEVVGILPNDRYKLKKEHSKSVVVVARENIRIIVDKNADDDGDNGGMN